MVGDATDPMHDPGTLWLKCNSNCTGYSIRTYCTGLLHCNLLTWIFTANIGTVALRGGCLVRQRTVSDANGHCMLTLCSTCTNKVQHQIQTFGPYLPQPKCNYVRPNLDFCAVRCAGILFTLQLFIYLKKNTKKRLRRWGILTQSHHL
jgi:hypothetical protein